MPELNILDIFKGYVLENWILIVILVAFVIVLATTSILSKKATYRLYILIAAVFLLSISVFIEFYFEKINVYHTARMVLMAIRYSATPFIIAQVIFAHVKKIKPFLFIPAAVLAVVDIVSIFTGIVFSVDESGEMTRGVLGYFPFIITGLYCAFLIYILYHRSNKRALEIIPIVFLAVAFLSGLIFPFIYGADYSKLFCPTVGAALFIHYVFSILELAKKDALTGLLNRQAYYAETGRLFKDITAIVSLDMNGLKAINDTYGHAVGDEALITLGLCLTKACKIRQSAYRMGGDEFAIVCHKNSEEEVIALVDRINKYISETKYTASIGYSYQKGGFANIDELLKSSDEKMYSNKVEFYKNKNK